MSLLRDLWAVLMVGRVRTKPLTATELAEIDAMIERLLPPEEIARMRAVPEPLPDPRTMPLQPCRQMETRTCPTATPCAGPCARFESDDPTPWTGQ